MTGSKRRGLADFLGKELKAPPPSAPREPELPKSQTSRVREKPLHPKSIEREVEVVVSPSLEAAVVAPELPKSVSPRVAPPAAPASEAPKSGSPGVPKSESPEVADGPLYMRLTRKEVRFRDEQLEALDRVARRLVRARKGGGERITENTLVRVAVDLLLARADDLAGTTEAELLRSLRGK